MVQVRNALNANKPIPPERGEDGEFLDSFMSKIENMTDEDFAAEANKEW